MRFEMQGFCRKYYPGGVEIFGKRPQALDLAAQRRPLAVSIDYFCGEFVNPLIDGKRSYSKLRMGFGRYSILRRNLLKT